MIKDACSASAKHRFSIAWYVSQLLLNELTVELQNSAEGCSWAGQALDSTSLHQGQVPKVGLLMTK